MDVTLFGMVTDVKPIQLEKALSPIDVTLFEMVTDVSPLQPSKALYLIDVTLSPNINSLIDVFPDNQELTVGQSKVNFSIELQPEKA